MGPIMDGMPLLRYTAAKVNIVIDGNSFVSGTGASTLSKTLPNQLKALAPLNGQITVTSTGVAGQSITDMRTRGTQYVDSLFNAAKTNVLIAVEGTNSVCNLGRTGIQAGQDMAAYCADRLAAQPWKIILLGTIPRFVMANWGVANGNAQLQAYNDYLAANHRAMGAKRYVDPRSEGIFIYTGATMDPIMSPYMDEGTHPNDNGYGKLAGYIANTLKRMPAR